MAGHINGGFDREWNAMQRPDVLSLQNCLFCGACLRQHHFGFPVDESVQAWIVALNTIEMEAGNLDRRNFFLADLRGDLARGRKNLLS
jgi:hypothetical protein